MGVQALPAAEGELAGWLERSHARNAGQQVNASGRTEPEARRVHCCRLNVLGTGKSLATGRSWSARAGRRSHCFRLDVLENETRSGLVARPLEGDPRSELERPRPAGAENLSATRGGLAEGRGAAQVEAVAAQVGDVKHVECLAV